MSRLSLTQAIPLTGSLIVTTPQDVALADVRRGVAMFERLGVPILGIIEKHELFPLSALRRKDRDL